MREEPAALLYPGDICRLKVRAAAPSESRRIRISTMLPPHANWRRFGLLLCLVVCVSLGRAEGPWRHLSSKTGDLPVPGTSTQQTGAVVADLDKDGVNDFVLSFRQTAPALVWYRRAKT